MFNFSTSPCAHTMLDNSQGVWWRKPTKGTYMSLIFMPDIGKKLGMTRNLCGAENLHSFASFRPLGLKQKHKVTYTEEPHRQSWRKYNEDQGKYPPWQRPLRKG